MFDKLKYAVIRIRTRDCIQQHTRLFLPSFFPFLEKTAAVNSPVRIQRLRKPA